MWTTTIMQGDFLGVHGLEDFLDILGYPEDTHKEVIDLIVEKVEAELPREVCWLPYTSELIGEYGKAYDFTEEDIKELISEKCGEVREETEDLQKDEEWFNDHSELEISGEFEGVGERYTDSFKNRGEFEWVLQSIARNGACCYPDRIYGDKTEDKLPKYVREWLKATGAEYIEEGRSGD